MPVASESQFILGKASSGDSELLAVMEARPSILMRDDDANQPKEVTGADAFSGRLRCRAKEQCDPTPKLRPFKRNRRRCYSISNCREIRRGKRSATAGDTNPAIAQIHGDHVTGHGDNEGSRS